MQIQYFHVLINIKTTTSNIFDQKGISQIYYMKVKSLVIFLKFAYKNPLYNNWGFKITLKIYK